MKFRFKAFQNVPSVCRSDRRFTAGRSLRRNLPSALLYLWLPVAPAVFVQGAMGTESVYGCPAPAGGFPEEVTNPPVTAQDVEGDRTLLREFLLHYVKQVSEGEADTWHTGCITRVENSPYYSGSTYLVSLTPDGRILTHAKDMSLSARQLNPQIYMEILSSLDVSADDIGNLGSSNPAVAGQSLKTIIAKLSEGQEGTFSVDGIPEASGHAASYYSPGFRMPLIILTGFDLTEAYLLDLVTEGIDYGNTSTRAEDVVDRDTLKKFVAEASDYMTEVLKDPDPTKMSKARIALRDPNGPWRHDSVYLYVYDSSSKQTVFHGAFPNRFELLNTGITKDTVTGEVVWDLVTAAARRRPEGGFLSYNFDNPSDKTDEPVLKIGYAIEIKLPIPRNDGTTTMTPFIIGSGFYPESVDAIEKPAPAEDLTCEIPDGISPSLIDNFLNPDIRAENVTDSQSLKKFIVDYRNKIKELEYVREERDSIYAGCIIRDKEGPYYSGSTYTMSLARDGRILIHAKDMSLSARQLNPEIYNTILAALGVPADTIANLNSPDSNVVKLADQEIFVKLSEGQDGAFSVDGIPEASGHAAVYNTSEALGSPPIILIAGFDLTEAHLVNEDIAHHDPSTEAKDVVDNTTLKKFVTEAAGYMAEILGTGSPSAQSRAVLELRDPDGPWKHGSIYLYVYEENTGQIVLHGGFPDRFEFRSAGISTDNVTGELVWDLVQEAAARREGEGGFFSYHFDKPGDESDEAVPKIGYARKLGVNVKLPDGSTIPYRFIVGSGYYPGELAAAEKLESGRSLKAWQVRFGRTVSQQVVDALQDRFAANPQAGLELTVAGERLNGTTPLGENQAALSKLLGFETVSSRQLVQDSSFSFTTSEHGAPASLSFWGTGAFSSFSGSEDNLSLDGNVTTAILGADWSGHRWRAGTALSRSWGSGSYDGDGENDADITTTLTSVFPYGRYALTPRLGIWATAGYGWGELSFKPDGAEYNPDTTLTMAAMGMDGLLLDGGGTGFTLSTTADALLVKTTSAEDKDLASSEGNLSRIRVGLEATRPVPLANGASLIPSMTLGLRHDRGDAETGFGVDLGAGLSWSAPELGISGELKGRTLLTHAEQDFQDQGLALSFSWDPSPSNNLGPSLSMRHTMGGQATGGMDALLNPVAMELPDTGSSSGQSLETQLAYGLAVFGERFNLTPALGLALSPDSRRYSLRWALQPYAYQGQGDAWELSLDAQRQEKSAATSPADHSLRLGFSLSL